MEGYVSTQESLTPEAEHDGIMCLSGLSIIRDSLMEVDIVRFSYLQGPSSCLSRLNYVTWGSALVKDVIQAPLHLETILQQGVVTV